VLNPQLFAPPTEKRDRPL